MRCHYSGIVYKILKVLFELLARPSRSCAAAREARIVRRTSGQPADKAPTLSQRGLPWPSVCASAVWRVLSRGRPWLSRGRGGCSVARGGRTTCQVVGGCITAPVRVPVWCPVPCRVPPVPPCSACRRLRLRRCTAYKPVRVRPWCAASRAVPPAVPCSRQQSSHLAARHARSSIATPSM